MNKHSSRCLWNTGCKKILSYKKILYTLFHFNNITSVLSSHPHIVILFVKWKSSSPLFCSSLLIASFVPVVPTPAHHSLTLPCAFTLRSKGWSLQQTFQKLCSVSTHSDANPTRPSVPTPANFYGVTPRLENLCFRPLRALDFIAHAHLRHQQELSVSLILCYSKNLVGAKTS